MQTTHPATATTTTPHALAATTSGTTSPRSAARVAGAAYAAMFVLAILANFVVVEGLVVAGDDVATLAALAADRGLLRLGIVAFLLIAVLDVLIAWALHVLLRANGHDRSLLAAWLRVVYSGLLAVSLASLLRADALVARADQLGEAAATEVAVALATFDLVWQVGLVFFGCHLLVVTALLVGPLQPPRGLRLLLGVAGVAYVVDALLQVGMTGHAAIADVMLPVVAVPSMLGEGWLTGWLLLRAGQDQARRSSMKR